MKAWFTVDEMNAWADKKLKENPHWNEASEKQDIPDLIAGALGVSRGTAYDLMREALAGEQEQEPVAEVAGRAGDLHIRFLPSGHSLQLGDKLYTSPQPAQPSKPWVGLTDINEMVEAELTHYWNGEYADTTGARDQLTDFARAIEAKLREKNS